MLSARQLFYYGAVPVILTVTLKNVTSTIPEEAASVITAVADVTGLNISWIISDARKNINQKYNQTHCAAGIQLTNSAACTQIALRLNKSEKTVLKKKRGSS